MRRRRRSGGTREGSRSSARGTAQVRRVEGSTDAGRQDGEGLHNDRAPSAGVLSCAIGVLPAHPGARWHLHDLMRAIAGTVIAGRSAAARRRAVVRSTGGRSAGGSHRCLDDPPGGSRSIAAGRYTMGTSSAAGRPARMVRSDRPPGRALPLGAKRARDHRDQHRARRGHHGDDPRPVRTAISGRSAAMKYDYAVTGETISFHIQLNPDIRRRGVYRSPG
jgi:hypothetical protein